MKKVFSIFLSVFILISSMFVLPASASYNSELDTSADIVLLFSLDDGSVIFDKNADKVTAPASLTKVITAVLAIEKAPDLDTVVTVPSYCITMLNGTGSSMAGLKAGEQVTVRQLLYCMLVKSANEAANILADYIGNGSVENFVSMMNEFATGLGCTNTHFVNAHGLDADGHYTTANDLAKIVQYALKLPAFLEISNTYTYKMAATNLSPERTLTSTNWMINPNFKTYYYSYAQGIKTGTTTNAGRCIISKASKDGYNYLAIVMGAPLEDVTGDGNPDNCAFLECKKIFQWVFANIKLTKIADITKIVTVVDVKLSFQTDHVRLVPAKDVTALVPAGADSGSVLIDVIKEETPSVVNAPIKKGDVIGKARILYADSEIATVDLVAAEDVNMNIFLWVLNGIKVVATSPIFLIIIAIVAVVLGVYFGLIMKQKKNKRKKRKVKMVKGIRNIKK